MRLRFLGAARTVTGSQYLLQLPSFSALVDCGMYQGRDAVLAENARRFAFDPAKLDFVLLTHAHIDHCGLLPRLWKLGFRGRIYCTSATRDLCEVMLADSAKIQEEDAVWEMRKWRRGQQATPPPAPLYTVEDAAAVMEHFVPVEYDADVRVNDDLSCRWVDAGHILGSASLEVWVSQDGVRRKIAFSGDLGTPGRPILRDPTFIDSADFVVTESTYGNRTHPPEEEVQRKLTEAITRTVRAGGHIIVPAFAVGRTQDLLYRLDRLLEAGRIPKVPVFVDSPLASQATKVFERHHECYDADSLRMLASGDNPIRFPSLRFTASVAESQALNELKSPAIIISASGMCNAGRVRHHLHHHIEHGNDTVLFVGYQAQGTLGRFIVEGAQMVKLFGRTHRVRARIVSIRGLSAHADQTELVKWSRHLNGTRTFFVTHGEEEAALSFAKLLSAEPNRKVCVPTLGEEVNLLDEAALDRARELTAAELARFVPPVKAPRQPTVEPEEI
jgi:metallo-beta-lactamase family protein